MNTRQTILAAVGILVIVAIGIWWYFGFTLDFMRFFAAEPGTDDRVVTRESPPPGCYYQNVVCVQAPCDPILVCPSCVPRPSCMDDDPPCAPDLAPGAVLCPPSSRMVACTPATQTVAVGDQANLSASGGSGAYVWFSPEGARIGGVIVGTDGPVTNAYSVRYDTPGIKKVTVESPRGDGSANVDSVACTVVVEPVGI